MSVVFAGPEMIETRSEKLERLKKEKDYGVISQVDFIAQYRGISKKEAKIIIEQINEDNNGLNTIEETNAENQ